MPLPGITRHPLSGPIPVLAQTSQPIGVPRSAGRISLFLPTTPNLPPNQASVTRSIVNDTRLNGGQGSGRGRRSGNPRPYPGRNRTGRGQQVSHNTFNVMIIPVAYNVSYHHSYALGHNI